MCEILGKVIGLQQLAQSSNYLGAIRKRSQGLVRSHRTTFAPAKTVSQVQIHGSITSRVPKPNRV